MKVKDVVRIAEEAVADNFANYDWQEEAVEAARKIANGDIALAKKIAKAARKLPAYAKDDEGIPSPFLFWENIRFRGKK